jgi:predicted nucleotidyltransferase
MPLPEFNSQGDLPEGVHRATFDETLARFGQGALQRQLVTARLSRIYELARRTGRLERFVIFGSYVTAKPDPNDVDIILVMRDDFREQDLSEETLPVFNHLRAQRELGASVFWIRADVVLLETVDQFVAHWQVKRDLTRRGIIEIILEGSE